MSESNLVIGLIVRVKDDSTYTRLGPGKVVEIADEGIWCSFLFAAPNMLVEEQNLQVLPLTEYLKADILKIFQLEEKENNI